MNGIDFCFKGQVRWHAYPLCNFFSQEITVQAHKSKDKPRVTYIQIIKWCSLCNAIWKMWLPKICSKTMSRHIQSVTHCIRLQYQEPRSQVLTDVHLMEFSHWREQVVSLVRYVIKLIRHFFYTVALIGFLLQAFLVHLQVFPRTFNCFHTSISPRIVYQTDKCDKTT